MDKRLKQFIEYLNYSVREFESSIGAANGVIRKFVTMGTTIQSALVEKICTTYPQLSAEWLLRGSGNMLLSEPDKYDTAVIALIRRVEELAIENYELKNIQKRQTTNDK